MPPVFTKLLAERLGASAKLKVVECQGDEHVRPGHIYIAKGDYHMRVKGGRAETRLALDQGPQENSCRPAVDVLFRSVAEVFGGAVLAVVLTGMGQDGLRGCQQLRELGATVVAQDQATSVIWGMPGAVVRAGLADRILPIQKIGPELVALTSGGLSPRRTMS
jgi:two-component system chemotaxis response regulator CheB